MRNMLYITYMIYCDIFKIKTSESIDWLEYHNQRLNILAPSLDVISNKTMTLVAFRVQTSVRLIGCLPVKIKTKANRQFIETHSFSVNVEVQYDVYFNLITVYFHCLQLVTFVMTCLLSDPKPDLKFKYRKTNLFIFELRTKNATVFQWTGIEVNGCFAKVCTCGQYILCMYFCEA